MRTSKKKGARKSPKKAAKKARKTTTGPEVSVTRRSKGRTPVSVEDVKAGVKNMQKTIMAEFNTPASQQISTNRAIIMALTAENQKLEVKESRELNRAANRLDKSLPGWRKYLKDSK